MPLRTPAHHSKQSSPQLSAKSPRTPFGPIDTRPTIHELRLPGIRRAQEGRGGSVAGVDALRMIARSPIIAAHAAAIPQSLGGRPAAVPDHYWHFYNAATRHFRSSDLLDQELRAHWAVVREEFWFEHGILLPDAKPNGDVPDGDDYRKWRKRKILPGIRNGQAVNGQRLEDLTDWLTDISLPLALSIRSAEGGDEPRGLLDPAIWDCIAADGTVMDAPSDVREEIVCNADGVVLSRVIHGSRAKNPADARIHDEVISTSNKPHGARKGLYNVVAATKGLDTYTRVVLGLGIGEAHEGEMTIAMRVLHAMYRRLGDQFPVLLYDGALVPVHFQELMAAYGVYCVNANYARLGAKSTPEVLLGPQGPQVPLGRGRGRYGVKKERDKRTYTTPLESVNHEAEGYVHQHHLAADDGAVYEINRHALAGGNIVKVGLLRPSHLERRQSPETGEYYFRLTLAGQCAHSGAYEVAYDLAKTP